HVFSRPRPQRPLEPSVVSRFPRCADKVARLARGIDKGDVLESPLNLRQLAALSLGRTRKVFREREVLHRQSDKGKGSGSVGPLSKLLQNVEVPIRGGVGVRLEVLAKLV